MKITAAEQHIVLKEHIRRTELLEEEMRPVKKHVYMIDGALKLIAITGIVMGVLVSIFELVKYFIR